MISEAVWGKSMPYKIIFQSVASVCFLCLFPASFLAEPQSRLVTHNKTYLCVVVNMSVSGPSDMGLIDLSLYEHTTPRCGDAMMRHKMKIICLLLEKCVQDNLSGSCRKAVTRQHTSRINPVDSHAKECEGKS